MSGALIKPQMQQPTWQPQQSEWQLQQRNLHEQLPTNFAQYQNPKYAVLSLTKVYENYAAPDYAAPVPSGGTGGGTGGGMSDGTTDSSALYPGIGIAWEKHAKKNCWWFGHGSEEVDSPQGSEAPGLITTLQECQASCLSHPECEGITVRQATDFKRLGCFRKKKIRLEKCNYLANYDLYIKRLLIPPPPPAPPSPPPVPPLPPSPPAPPPLSVAASINARFHRKPYSATWTADGAPPEAAVLIHMFDGWEDHAHGLVGYKATAEVHEGHISSSIIYADQQSAINPRAGIPVYSSGALGHYEGIVFRPGPSSKILCGNAKDTGGGECSHDLCPHVDLDSRYEPEHDGRDGCGSSWAPRDMGVFLYRSGRWQKEIQAKGHPMDYNEVILDGLHWNAHLPHAIEAFFGAGDLSKHQHQMFLKEYGLTAEQVPLLVFNPHNWDAPFSLRQT